MNHGILAGKYLTGLMLLLGLLLVTTLTFTDPAQALTSIQDPPPAEEPSQEAKETKPIVDEDDILGGEVGIPASEPAALEVIQKYLDAVGGRETLLSISDRVEIFKNKKIDPTNETVMKMARFIKRTGASHLCSGIRR